MAITHKAAWVTSPSTAEKEKLRWELWGSMTSEIPKVLEDGVVKSRREQPPMRVTGNNLRGQ